MIMALPADNYVVINKTSLNENDRKILTMLYQPIIGSTPISLYFTLWSDLDKASVMSRELAHHHLMTSMKLKLDEIVSARKRLEAIGLLKTYVKEDSVNSFVYELYSPLSEYDFFNHPILSVVLYNNIDNKEFERLTAYFKSPKINLKEYSDITASFNDVFDIKPLDKAEVFIEDIRNKEVGEVNIKSNFDFDLLTESLGRSITSKTLTKEVKDLISKLSLVYNIDVTHMTNILRNVINESGIIKKEELRRKTKEYYQFETNGKLPSLVTKTQPDALCETYNDNSKKTKIIYQFETISPYDFLMSKYNGSVPTNRDLKLLEILSIDYELNPGVINVLVDYVLRISNQKLSKEYVEAIAGVWKRLKVKRVAEAMNIAEMEHKKRKKPTTTKFNQVKEEKLPEWFDKKLEKTEATDSEIKEMEELLSKY